MQLHHLDLQSPWLDVSQGAIYARVSKKLLYRAVSSGRLKAARVGGRRQVRLRREWLMRSSKGTSPRQRRHTRGDARGEASATLSAGSREWPFGRARRLREERMA